MSKYRARHCPNCNYFVGFTVARKHIKGRPISITNFCLNCNYKLPVYSIVRGIRTPTRSRAEPRCVWCAANRNCLGSILSAEIGTMRWT